MGLPVLTACRALSSPSYSSSPARPQCPGFRDSRGPSKVMQARPTTCLREVAATDSLPFSSAGPQNQTSVVKSLPSTRRHRHTFGSDPALRVITLNQFQASTCRVPASRRQKSQTSTQALASSAAQQDDLVLVVGALGGVGQLAVASLLDKGVPVRAIVRSADRAKAVFGDVESGLLDVVAADLRFPEQLTASVLQRVTRVVLAIGTTAFPSKRWDGDNGPEQTDYISVKNILDVLPKTVQHLVFVSSVGVTRYNSLPYNILNLFGTLKYKKMAEDLVKVCGIPYTILRPGRLTDGPYTSYDLNTLLKATSGARKSVVVKRGDSLNLETSRLAVAEAAVQALFSDAAKNEAFEIASVEGPWAGSNIGDWDDVFAKAPHA